MDAKDYHAILNDIPSFPHLEEENNQLVGHTSSCKHCFQCGFLRTLCQNPKSITKFCLFGWYTGGLIPDELCKWYEPNPYWQSISTNYFVSRKHMIEKMVEGGLNATPIGEISKKVGNVGDFIYKPVNVFLLGTDKNTTSEDVVKKWPFLQEGIYKQIYNVNFTENIEKTENEFKEKIKSVPNMGMVPCIILKWKDDLPDEFIDKMHKIIEDYESVQTVNIATRLVHSEVIQENESYNLAWLNHSKWAYDMYKLFEGKPILCIAAGPTLNAQLELIRKHQNKFVIFCVSTVAKTLMLNGITPHIIGTIDMKSENKAYLEVLTDDFCKKPYLMFEIDAHREVVDAYKGKRMMAIADLDRAPMTNELSALIPTPFILPKSGTVSNLIYNMARYTYPKFIALAGYDLCYTTEDTHTEGSLFKGRVKIVEASNGFFLQFNDSTSVEEGIYVETNRIDPETGKNCTGYTTKSFYTYLVELNLRINTDNPRILTYDTGIDSTKKEGAEYKSLEDICAELEPLKEDVFELLDNLNDKKLSNSIVKKYLKNIGEGDSKRDVRYNHASKLTYLLRQYSQFPVLKYPAVYNNIENRINVETKGILQKLSSNALEIWRKRNDAK